MICSSQIGILAYGSLRDNPNCEIEPLIVRRIPAKTPFPVEFARLSTSRGGAPTVVPHRAGKPVNAEILVLAGSVALGEAKSLLYRREVHKEGSGLAYQERTKRNAVLIRDEPAFHGIDHVLYTDFREAAKISQPDPRLLAEAAVASLSEAKKGEDGISYLLGFINSGGETSLTQQYRERILATTGAKSLEDVLQCAIPSVSERMGANT